MKQNKNTSVVIRVSSFCIALVILFFSLAIPSFAEESINWNSYISPVFLGTDSSATRYNGGLPFLNTSNSYRGSTTTTNLTVYQCLIYDGSSKYYTFLSETEGTPGNGKIIRPSGASYESYNAQTTGHEGGIAYSAVYIGGTLNTENATVPVFSSFEEAATSLDSFLNGGSTGGTAQQITYQIPAGYVAFFDIHGLSNIQGSVLASSGIPLTPSEWASTNILYGYSSSIPSSFSLPLSGSTSFTWRTGKTNIYGKSQSWSWLGTFAGGSNYLFVSNPTYSNVMGVQSNGTSMILDNPSATNSYVTVYLAEAYSVKLVSLNALITYDPSSGNYGGVDDGSGDSSYSVDYDPNTGTWITTDDSNGLPVGVDGIPVGGDNSIDIPSEFSTITAWLENIANTIGAFFRGAIGAVSTLVGAGSAFINQLVSLYSWLPAPVYAVLSSALILVITIGVIKVFI